MEVIKRAVGTELSLVTSFHEITGQGSKIFYGIKAQFPGKIFLFDDLSSDCGEVLKLLELLNGNFIDEVQFKYILEDFVQSLYML